jgi:phenylacetate-CoA ligase
MTTTEITHREPSAEVERLRALTASLLARDEWPPERRAEHRRSSLRALLRYAVDLSPHYRETLGVDAAERPFSELPTLSKATLMEEFDRVVTDPRLRLAEIEAHLGGPDAGRPFLGDYRLYTTSGTSGLRGVFVYTSDEFAQWAAATLRAIVRFGVGPSARLASIGAPGPLHVTNQLFAALRAGREGAPRLSVLTPVTELVETLNDYRPEVIATYASLAALLAREQLEGRLDIAPTDVFVGSEVLTAEMREAIRAAWGSDPHEAYASTEVLMIAQSVPGRAGLHTNDDLAIVEVVDEQNRPVPAGVPGHRVLLTNLVNRALPLIRYELSDSVTLAEDGSIASVDGRSDDVVLLPGRGGVEVTVPPYRLCAPFARLLDVRQYQVTYDGSRLHVRVVLAAGAPRGTAGLVRDALAGELEAAQAIPPPIDVEPVATIPREPGDAAKVKLVKVERPG